MVVRLLSVVVLALFAGCVFEVLDRDHFYGTTTLAWTIGGRSDPARCADNGAAFVHIVVRDEDEVLVQDDWVSCREMMIRYVLHRGWYGARLTLTDATHAAISTTRASGTFYVDDDRDSLVVVDLTPNVIEPTSTGDIQ